MPSKPSPSWHVVRESSIHNTGVFAARDIPRGTKIIEYVGERINKTEGKRRADALLAKSKDTGGAAVYIFDLNERWDLDGDVPWNTARFINHSCEPNCAVYDYRGRLWITAKRRIAQGEELTYNYGFDLEHWEDHPCRCGTASCVGHILDRKYWRKLAAEKKRRAGALPGTPQHFYDPLHAARKTRTRKPAATKKTATRKRAAGEAWK
jgi:hypothetical protein